MQLNRTFDTNARQAETATIVAPFDYSQLIWATALGFFIWGETPAANAFAGALVVAASGLYIFRREAYRRRQQAQ